VFHPKCSWGNVGQGTSVEFSVVSGGWRDPCGRLVAAKIILAFGNGGDVVESITCPFTLFAKKHLPAGYAPPCHHPYLLATCQQTRILHPAEAIAQTPRQVRCRLASVLSNDPNLPCIVKLSTTNHLGTCARPRALELHSTLFFRVCPACVWK